ncbi:MAG: class I SAM-dependent methyltransferase [Nitrosopumilus sp.]|nr:class I SAM-dependent methyltransferase [Nitrosopumilus sp.]
MTVQRIKAIIKKMIKPTDRTEKYWKKAASKDVESVMESICDHFDKKTFDTKKEALIFSQNIKFDKNMKILDLACGMGRTCKWVAPHVNEYVGVDFIPEMIRKAKEYNNRFKNAKFVVNDGKSLNVLDSDYFDLAYSELAFQHMLKPIQESYVREILRVLKKGGLFYVQIPRIEYYNDKTYSRTKKETDELFQKFLVTYENTSDAYYYIKAEK